MSSRGRKVYRRFDDDDDQEEDIDTDGLDLSGHTTTNSKSFKALTRRSIKPKRLFQNEAQKKARDVREEEEALTDIEEDSAQNGDAPAGMSVDSPRAVSPGVKTGRSLRSTGKVHLVSDANELNSSDGRTAKNTSPFDSWPRLKSAGSSTGGVQKGRKRGAPETLDGVA